LLLALNLALTSPAPALAQAVAPIATTALEVEAAVAEASHRFGLPASWIWAVMRVESGGAERAVSPAGAMGLMQIMPATWRDLRGRHGLGADPFTPRDNILAGAAYLRELYDRYGAPGFLAAYNAGPKRYEDAVIGGAQLPAETRSYLAKLAPLVIGAPPSLSLSPPDPWRSSLFAASPSTTPATVSPIAPAEPLAPSSSLSAIPRTGLFPARSGLEGRR
jgi:soluble lytic murein transglycosylase-like protein